MIDISNILGKKEGLHLEAKSARGGFPDSFWPILMVVLFS